MIDYVLKRVALTRCRRKLLPEEVCRYVEANRGRHSKGVPLDDVRFVVFDTETTGFDTAADKVISIGAVAVTKCRIDVGDSFEVLVRQHSVGQKESVSVHGLLKRDIAEGADERDALLAFIDFIGGSTLVAQHASFDTAMLDRLLRRHFGIRLFNGVVDTASLAKRLEKGPYYNLAHKAGEYRLDNLLERYGIRLYDRHTAPGDAYLTALLLQRLLRKGEGAGIRTLGSLLMD